MFNVANHIHNSGVPLVTVTDDVAGIEVHHHHSSVSFHLEEDLIGNISDVVIHSSSSRVKEDYWG